ncbi:MAG: hypothetical protein RJA81_1294, partial [Planctomycetota bacterium]
MKIKLWHAMMAVVRIAIISWSVSLGFDRARQNLESNRSTDAARLVAYLCGKHMKENGQQWPGDWDDFRTLQSQSALRWTFDELVSRVGVRWDAQPDQLGSESGYPPLIWVAGDPDFP